MPRRETPIEVKIEVLTKFYEQRKKGMNRPFAAAFAGKSLVSIDRWEKELEAKGIKPWQR